METRLWKFRKAKGLTQGQLAKMAGTTQQHIHRLEKDAALMSPEWLSTFAEIFDIQEGALLEPKRVPLVGRVGAGAQVFPIDDYEPGAASRKVDCPVNLNPKVTVAVEVEGDSMLPINSGWLLFYSRHYEVPPSELVGKLCVVKIADDGPMLVKNVRRGSEKALFTLISSNAPPIEDAELEWATRVLEMQPPA